MTGYCTLVLYFHSPAARETTATHLCNIQPYCLLTHQVTDLSYTTLTLEDRQLWRMRGTKVVAVCIFNELQTAGLFLALDGTSTRTDPSTSGRKHRKLVYIAVFIRNESLFIVLAAAMSAFQLEHTPRLVRSICPAGYEIWASICHVGL